MIKLSWNSLLLICNQIVEQKTKRKKLGIMAGYVQESRSCKEPTLESAETWLDLKRAKSKKLP